MTETNTLTLTNNQIEPKDKGRRETKNGTKKFNNILEGWLRKEKDDKINNDDVNDNNLCKARNTSTAGASAETSSPERAMSRKRKVQETETGSRSRQEKEIGSSKKGR